MEQSTSDTLTLPKKPKEPTDQFFKNVLLLKNGDFERIGGQVLMPTASEIATIKSKAQLGQFERKVHFFASMSEDMVKKKLEQTFPYLRQKRFSCAAVIKLNKDSSRFEFYGSPRLWNGKTIKSKIKGNSALYILEDEVATSDDVTFQISGLDESQMETDNEQQEVSVCPGTRTHPTNLHCGNHSLMGITSTDGSSTMQEDDSSIDLNQLQMTDSLLYGMDSPTSTTSGISVSDGEYLSQEELFQWMKANIHYVVSVRPKESPLQGGDPCCFTFDPPLQPDVTSGFARFEDLGVIELERMKNGSLLGYFPASPVPWLVRVKLESQDGIYLGKTEVTYFSHQMRHLLQQIVYNPSLQMSSFYAFSNNTGTSEGETQSSRSFGYPQQVQMLSLLVYAAAESGAQQFLEMIFTSSAGRVAFDTYKDSLTLPEVIAKNHGNEEAANYLGDITKRFSEEIRTVKECSLTVDWSELVEAAMVAQEQLVNKTITLERDGVEELKTGYLGDVEGSSNESSGSSSSLVSLDVSSQISDDEPLGISSNSLPELPSTSLLKAVDADTERPEGAGTTFEANEDCPEAYCLSDSHQQYKTKGRTLDADEYSRSYSGRKPVVKKSVKAITIFMVKDPVDVGQNAKINGVPLCQSEDDEPLSSNSLAELPDTSLLKAIDESSGSNLRLTSLSDSSQISDFADECSGSSGRRKPVVKKFVKNITISKVKGPFVVGKNAKINGVPLNQPRDDEPLSSLNSLPELPSTSILNAVDAANDTETPEGAEKTFEVREDCPEAHCPIDSHQCEEKGRALDTGPSKGIMYHTGDAESQWSIQTFLENPEKFIKDMDINAAALKEEKEVFLLNEILPRLEKSWGKCFSSNEKIYEVLAKISCSEKSGKVVREALKLLLHLICKDNFDNCKEDLLLVEAVVRSSFLSPVGRFMMDRNPELDLKLHVYSRVLSFLVIQQVLKGELPTETLKQELKRLQNELKRFSKKIKKKDGFRYSIEFIQKAIPYLLKPPIRLKTFIEECQEFCLNKEINSSELKILRELKRTGKWIDLHCILNHLHGKVHSGRPIPQMETERRAMTLLRLLVETYLNGGGGDDWKFCFLADSVLSDIAMNNNTKEIRNEAGGCLVYPFKDLKVQKTPNCRAFVQRRSSEMLFCPDKETRTFLVHFLSQNENLQHDLPADLHTKHLSSSKKMYRTQALEITQTTISQSTGCFIKTGMFQRKKVAVKVLLVKKQHLLEENPTFHARESLIKEAHYLKLLNESCHPNIPVLLSYDTKSFPYHLITAYEKWGDLLQFVRKSRGSSPHLQPIHLLRMLIDILDALLYLERQGLVHRAVIATNVLVGDGFVCKLSGMQCVRQLTNQADYDDSLYSYCSVDDGSPEFISTTNDEELPVRWQAPECLLEHRYSTSSDVWGFGVLMYEVLTYGCIPYRNILKDDEVPYSVTELKDTIPFEMCFEENEHELMKQCCAFQRNKRPALSQIKAQLQEMHENADEEQSRPDPPSLDNYVTYESSSLGNSEDIYSSIPDIQLEETYSRAQSVEEEQYASYDFYDECISNSSKESVEMLHRRLDYPLSQIDDRPTRQVVQDITVVTEKISREDVQHLTKLLTLKHPNLVPIQKIDRLDSICPTVEIMSTDAPLGNLKEYVLAQRCRIEDIVTFLSQVASALHYLHVNHIVHGDLRAEYVNVVAQDKVTKIQVGRLGRSKPLYMSAYEVTSTSCVVEAFMPPDATRWSAPEVILDRHYTHASDVWAFGILAWELYTSFTNGQDGQDGSVPFCGLRNDQILARIRDHGPLNKPEGCPDWVYIIMHQCWAYESMQRPPFLAIFDCLTSREPMRSWIMTVWKANHDESEWPDLSICQSEDACHVTETDTHPSKDVIEKMCSEEFFAKHNYKYVENISGAIDVEEESYACPWLLVEERNSEEKENLDRSPAYQDPHSSDMSVERDHKFLSVKETHNKPEDNESGYLCPVAMDAKDQSSTGHQPFYQNAAEVVRSKKSHIESCQAEVGSRTANETVYSKVTKVKKSVVEYSNDAFTLDQDEASWDDDVESMTTYDTPGVAYQNLAYVFNEGHISQDKDAEAIEKHETCPEEYESMCMVRTFSNDSTRMEEDTVACSYDNAAYYTCLSSTGAKDQQVPENGHPYANAPKRDAMPQLEIRTGQPHIEDDYQEREKLPHPKSAPDDTSDLEGGVETKPNFTLKSWMKDPEFEIEFYI